MMQFKKLLRENERQNLQNIEANPDFIKLIENPTEDEMMLAIDLDPETMRYFVEKVTDNVKAMALTKYPFLIKYFPDEQNRKPKIYRHIYIPDNPEGCRGF